MPTAATKMTLEPQLKANETANNSPSGLNKASFSNGPERDHTTGIMPAATSHTYAKFGAFLPVWIIAIMVMTIGLLVVAINQGNGTGMGVMSAALLTAIVAFVISVPDRTRDKQKD